MKAGRILIVDDQPTNLKLAAEVLAWAGYEVDQAADAEQALEKIGRRPPALILTDIALPHMDGLALTRKLKADPALRHIPIVALTAFAMKGDEQKALEAGCDGYLAKPIDTRALAGQVAQWLKRGG